MISNYVQHECMFGADPVANDDSDDNDEDDNVDDVGFTARRTC